MLVYIRGAGLTASAIARRLFHANCRIVMSDREHPYALRRTVCFSEALRTGETTIEGIGASAAKDPEDAVHILRENRIAVIADPEGNMRGTLPFDACIDTVTYGDRTDTSMADAPIVIGIGERFVPGKNCHASVIAYRAGYRGLVRYEGSDLPEDLPADSIRVRGNTFCIQVPGAGLFYPVCEIGDAVSQGDTLAVVDSEPVVCLQDGMVCGILAEGTPVSASRFCAEIYTGKNRSRLLRTPEEMLAVGGGVLEALLHFREIY